VTEIFDGVADNAPDEVAGHLHARGAVCPVCNEERPIFWVSVSHHKYLRCNSCGLAYLEQTPSDSELEVFYNKSFQVDRESQGKKIDRESGSLLGTLRRFLPEKGRLLEIGCSYGHFLRRARQNGWEVQGVEISRAAVDWARGEFGLPVCAGTLEEVSSALGMQYDVVVMLHVLEHDPEPARLIYQVKRLLLPGGILVIKTPNSSSWIADVCGRTWEWLTPPAHIYLFSPVSLRLLLEQADFDIESLKTQRGDAHNTLFQMIRSVTKRIVKSEGRALPSGMPPPSRRGWYRGIEAASDLLYAPFEPLERIFLNRQLRHPELLVVARRGRSERHCGYRR
jgi:2-polyprenyl-3-methyl-5-hydroxy-6-metoxy-1,4-benzoquinol methylase